MTTEMINIKLDSLFLKNMDKLVKKEGYHNRTEFIRSALRDKIEEIKLKKAMFELSYLKGASKKKISKAQYEKARVNAFEEISKKLK